MISSISSSSNMTSMIQMRQQMFSKIDTNGDGKHDAEELGAMVANGPQGGPGAEEIITQFDTDGDGSISETEFNAADPGSSGATSGPRAMSTEDFISQMFSKMDENEDGTIDEDELAQMVAMGPENGPSTEELLSQLDTDGDGAISETEFSEGAPANQQVMGPPPPPPPAQDTSETETETETETIFSQLDTDGDGTISESEFDTAMNSIDTILSSASDEESDSSVSDVMEMLSAALNAYQQANSASYSSYTQASQGSGSSLYA